MYSVWKNSEKLAGHETTHCIATVHVFTMCLLNADLSIIEIHINI